MRHNALRFCWGGRAAELRVPQWNIPARLHRAAAQRAAPQRPPPLRVRWRESRHRAARARNHGRGEADGAPEEDEVHAEAREPIALGDINMPRIRKDGTNLVSGALTGGGLITSQHPGRIGSSVTSANPLAQVAMFPKTTQAWSVDISEEHPCGKLPPGRIVHDHPSLDRLHRPILENHPSIY
jgi:hypothetical protein